MNYYEAYKRLVLKAKKENICAGYTSIRKMKASKNGNEIHHIKPKCLCDDDSFSNLVLLSHDDHIYAHWLMNLSYYQCGNFKALNKLMYGKFLSIEHFKRNAFRGLKIQLSLLDNPCMCLGKFTLRQAAMYVAALKLSNMQSMKDMTAAMHKALTIAMCHRSFGGLRFKLQLPAS